MLNKLSPAKVRSVSKPGMHADGGNLWLHVSPTGVKSWIFRYMLHGRSRDMGIGPLHTVGLAEARERARVARQLVLDAVDPIEHRNADREAKRVAVASAVTFETAATQYIRSHEAGWKGGADHARTWRQTLVAYVYPVIGKLPVAAVDTGHVTKILEPIWTTVPTAAAKTRARIEAILDFARVRGWRDGANPAAWKGHLSEILPSTEKVRATRHHAALAWREIAVFMEDLKKRQTVSSLALRFLILTAARPSEACEAEWSEVDIDHALWTVPAARMKAEREHRVPLSSEALAVLRELEPMRQTGTAFVFPGLKGKPLSRFAMGHLMQRVMGRTETVHGFRSTFRDWCGDHNVPADIAEASLAHAAGDATVVAYARSDLLERRRRLMQQWGEFCSRAFVAGEVVELRRGSAR
jgi:integrase